MLATIEVLKLCRSCYAAIAVIPVEVVGILETGPGQFSPEIREAETMGIRVIGEQAEILAEPVGDVQQQTIVGGIGAFKLLRNGGIRRAIGGVGQV